MCHHQQALIRIAVAAVLLTAGQGPSLAQTAPAETTPAADPPARVGRIARINGTVSFHGPGAENWLPATLNYPITTGDGIWTEPGASAAIDIAASRVTLAESTEFEIGQLDDHALVATEAQGQAYLHLRDVQPGETATILTPRGTLTISAAGRYEVVAGDTEHPTTITVVDGAASVVGDGQPVALAAGQTATITGSDSHIVAVGPEALDPFLTTMLDAERPVAAAAPVPAPPPVVAHMTGSDDLAQSGDWQRNDNYGQVWYPRVSPGWAPYRDGRWDWVDPWGWTWVDAAPWGFATSHYGRWVEIDDRWAWAPVTLAPPPVFVVPSYYPPEYVAPYYEPSPYIEPCYAPALVSFFGFDAGFAFGVGVGIGIGAASVGWVPLGPGEPYHPWYHASRTYIHNVNITNVTKINNIHNTFNNSTINTFVNHRGATVVPASVLTGSEHVAPHARPIPPAQLAAIRPASEPPVRPGWNTQGVTPAVARRLGLRETETPFAHQIAPGPGIGPHGATQPGITGAHFVPGRPGLQPPLSAERIMDPRPIIGPQPLGQGGTAAGSPPRPGPNPPAITAFGPALLPSLRQPGARSVVGATGVPGPAIAPRMPNVPQHSLQQGAPVPAAPGPVVAAHVPAGLPQMRTPQQIHAPQIVPQFAPQIAAGPAGRVAEPHVLAAGPTLPPVPRATPAPYASPSPQPSSLQPPSLQPPSLQHFPAPAPRGVPPVQRDARPPQNYLPPSLHEVPPVQRYAGSVPHDVPPVQHFTPPVQRYSPPVQAYAPPAQHYAPPVQHYAPPVQHYSPPVQHYAPPVQRYIPPASHPIAPLATPKSNVHKWPYT